MAAHHGSVMVSIEDRGQVWSSGRLMYSPTTDLSFFVAITREEV